MDSERTTYQCDVCRRYFDEHKCLIAAKFIACVPESFICAQSDCAEFRAELDRQDAAAAGRRIQRAADRRRRTDGGGQKSTCVPQRRIPVQSAGFVHRGCPAERDDDRGQTTDGGEQFATSTEREKESLLDVENQCKKLHEFLKKQPLGEWFSNGFLMAHLGFSHLNNVASKLRARLDEEGLPLDVDTRSVSAKEWEYRLCHKSDSLRLQRDNPSREEKS